MDSAFYKALNTSLRSKQRDPVKPFVRVIWLLLHALRELPAYTGRIVVRGVAKDLANLYTQGMPAVVWPSFTSCTESVRVLSDPLFLGTNGTRTFLMIELTACRARSISDLSMVGNEKEILLPPNSRFEVVAVLGPSADGRLDVQLRELQPLDPILTF